jgi:hypothetical protein
MASDYLRSNTLTPMRVAAAPRRMKVFHANKAPPPKRTVAPFSRHAPARFGVNFHCHACVQSKMLDDLLGGIRLPRPFSISVC